MRRNILSLSIAAVIGGIGFSGAATASVLSTNSAATNLQTTDTGIGHILLVPYFTTQNGNATLINLVNTDTANGKAVKVRFRGASNSDDIFDFQVYLSPSDVWTANISKGADGRSQLSTTDKTCTLPAAVGTQTNSFDTSRLPASFTAAQKATETNEGYIEILNMADIPKALLGGQSNVGGTVSVNPLFTAIKHVAGVPPCGGALNSLSIDPKVTTAGNPAGVAAANGTELAASTFGLTNPTGGLFLNYTIVNVPSTLAFTQAAVAVVANTGAGTAPAKANLVFSPQTSTPISVANTFVGVDGAVAGVNPAAVTAPAPAAVVNDVTADALFRSANAFRAGIVAAAGAGIFTTPVISAKYYDQPDMSTPYLSNNVAVGGAAAVSPSIKQALSLTTAIETQSVVNEYLTTIGLAAFTDWTFSMPTRRYSVAMDYAWTSTTQAGSTDGRVFTDLSAAASDGSAANAIGVASTKIFFNLSNTSVSANQICVNADTINGLQSWDREETTATAGFVISPGLTTQVRFCGEASVLSFNGGGVGTVSVLGSSVARQDVTLPATEGWIRIGTAGLANGNVAPAALNNGLPVIGASYSKAVNSAVAAGTSGNFGLVAPHRYVR